MTARPKTSGNTASARGEAATLTWSRAGWPRNRPTSGPRTAARSKSCGPPEGPGRTTAAGHAAGPETTDGALQRVVRARVLTERDGKVWPGFDEDVIFELGIERALLTLTSADGPFPAGPTIWKAGDGQDAKTAAPSGIVT